MIKGELTNLRAIEFEDVATVQRWLNDPAVMAGWGQDFATVSRVVTGRRLGAWIDTEERLGRPVAFVIEDLGERPIGLLIADPADHAERELRLSILIGSPDDWGQGFGRDALESLIDAAFNGWNIHRLWLEVEAGNERAERLYRGLGFRLEATLRGAHFRNGGRHDVLQFALLAGDSMESQPATSNAQDPNELFDVVGADGEPTGRTKPRWQVHRDGDWHRAVHLWIFGVEAGRSFIDVQQRGLEKDTWPGRFDATVAGHLRAGEGLAEALRETEEEVGISVDLDETIRAGNRYSVSEGEVLDREIHDLLLLRRDQPLTAYRPNADELAAIVRIHLNDAIALLAGQVDMISGMALRPGESEPQTVEIRADQFIPRLDQYYLRAALSVQRVLNGENIILL